MGDISERPEHGMQINPSDNFSGLPAKIKSQITNALSKVTAGKTVEVLATLLRGAEVGKDIVKMIDKSLVYIAKIPKHLEEEFASGALTFMQKSDTGESLGAIVGSNHLNRGYVRIEETYLSNANLLNSLGSLTTQMQLAHIAEVLDDVRSRVIALQEVHDHDLLGELRGMNAQLLQMKDAKEPDNRKQLANSAITVLNTIRGKTIQRLIDELNKMPEVPRNNILAGWKAFSTKSFVPDTRQGYGKIQELFGYYLAATQLLAYTYAFLDEQGSYESVFTPERDLVENSNLSKLALAEKYIGFVDETWYKNPETFLSYILAETQKTFCKSSDTIEIEVTGMQLLEVMNDVGFKKDE